jgi:type IV pilus assembly protein PilY1
VQTFYGIVDRNTGTDTDRVADRLSLTAQQILVETSADPDGSGPLGSINVRVTSNNTLSGTSGWYLDLVSPVQGYQAEKQVTNPIVRNGRVIFTTLLPDSDPCSSGGGSWIMELNALDGSRLTSTPFDINNDSQFTSADNVTVTLPDGTQVTVPVSGLGSNEGILQSPGVIEGEVQGGLPVQFKYLPGSSGGIQRVTENPGAGGTGRQSWRQIR